MPRFKPTQRMMRARSGFAGPVSSPFGEFNIDKALIKGLEKDLSDFDKALASMGFTDDAMGYEEAVAPMTAISEALKEGSVEARVRDWAKNKHDLLRTERNAQVDELNRKREELSVASAKERQALAVDLRKWVHTQLAPVLAKMEKMETDIEALRASLKVVDSRTIGQNEKAVRVMDELAQKIANLEVDVRNIKTHAEKVQAWTNVAEPKHAEYFSNEITKIAMKMDALDSDVDDFAMEWEMHPGLMDEFSRQSYARAQDVIEMTTDFNNTEKAPAAKKSTGLGVFSRIFGDFSNYTEDGKSSVQSLAKPKEFQSAATKTKVLPRGQANFANKLSSFTKLNADFTNKKEINYKVNTNVKAAPKGEAKGLVGKIFGFFRR